jgi:N-acetylneuraminate synthase
MSYIDYRHRMELKKSDFEVIDARCKELGISWFASCWDQPSVDFIEEFAPPAYKAASASLTDLRLLKKMKATGRPLIISTGMSSMAQIVRAVQAVGTEKLVIAHATSSYPCKLSELNLHVIGTLRDLYPMCPIGYSGHETGLAPTQAAVALGACLIERHITLDRAMWGSDHAASVEPGGLRKLVQNIRDIEEALGDGVKQVYDSERPAMEKLRLVNDSATAEERRLSLVG